MYLLAGLILCIGLLYFFFQTSLLSNDSSLTKSFRYADFSRMLLGFVQMNAARDPIATEGRWRVKCKLIIGGSEVTLLKENPNIYISHMAKILN